MFFDSKLTPQQRIQNLFLAGTTSIFAQTFAAPFECLDQLFFGIQPIGWNKFGSLNRFINEEGFLALWIGNVGKLFKFCPQQIIGFALNDRYKEILSIENPSTKREFWKFSIGNLVAGGLAGGAALLVESSIGLSRVRYAIAKKGRISVLRQSLESNDYLMRMYMKNDVQGLCRGFFASLGVTVMYRAIYFGGYETAKKVIFPEGGFIEKFLLAQGVTSLAGLVSFPLEIVRRRTIGNLMEFEGQERYKGIVGCVKKVAAEEGWKGFVKGVHRTLIPGIAPALNLVLYDELQRRLFQKDERI